LLGLAVGDALGAPRRSRKMTAPLFPELAEGPILELLGGPTRKLGQVTHAVQQACALALSLKTLGKYDPDEALKSYLAWSKVAVVDEGGPELPAAFGLAGQRGQSAQTVGRDTWLATRKSSADNGALSRAVVLGVFFSARRQERLSAVLEDTAITHFDPRCQLAGVFLSGMIASAVAHGEEPSVESVLGQGTVDLTEAAALLGRRQPTVIREVQSAVEAVRDDVAEARKDNPGLYNSGFHLHQQETFVRVAFRMAVWEFLHAPGPREGMLDAVNRGGATDTHASLSGALLGAISGEAQLPQDWKASVLAAPPLIQGRPLRDFHPEQLLKLVSGTE